MEIFLRRRIQAAVLLFCLIWGLLAVVAAMVIGIWQMDDLWAALSPPHPNPQVVAEILRRPVAAYFIIFLLPLFAIASEYQAIENFLVKKLKKRASWKGHEVRR